MSMQKFAAHLQKPDIWRRWRGGVFEGLDVFDAPVVKQRDDPKKKIVH
jgi:hypothetical protein